MMLISMKNKIFQYTSKVSGNVLCSQCKRHLLFSVLITYLISKWGTGDINGMGGVGGGGGGWKIKKLWRSFIWDKRVTLLLNGM